MFKHIIKSLLLIDIDADGDGFPNRVGFAHLMMAVSPARTHKNDWGDHKG